MSNFSILIPALLLLGCADTGGRETKILRRVGGFSATEAIVDSASVEGWGADIRLSITEIVQAEKLTIYKVNSLYKHKKIGFDAIFFNKEPGTKVPFQALHIRNSGLRSDNLLFTLSELYGNRVDTSEKFVDEIMALARPRIEADQKDNPDIKKFAVVLSPKTEEFAELYININEKEHWLEIREMNIKQRRSIIKLLTAK